MGAIAFFIGAVPVYWYGCTAAIAALLALVMLYVVLWLRDENTASVWDLFLAVIPMGVIFSRIGHVFYDIDVYMASPFRIIDFSYGGFSLYGGAVGFLLSIWIYSLVKDLSFWYLLDCMAAPVLLGLVVMQVGYFCLQLTVGTPLPMDIPNDHTIAEYIEYRYRPSGFENYEYFRPISLYQAGALLISCVVIFFITWAEGKSFRLNEGCIFLLSAVCVGLIRFLCGFMYLSVKPGLHTGQILSLGAVCIALIMLYKRFNARPHCY